MAAKREKHFWLVSVLFWFVGLSSWITITALFAELSLMVKDLSEGFEIWSYITLIIQLANIGPLLYSFIPRKWKTQQLIIICGYFIFILSFFSMILMSCYWDISVFIFGEHRSLMLYITTFGTSICDCMTSIIFWVFVSYFPTQYMAIMSAGESSSGVICAILIYIQQLNRAEDNPRFSAQVYFLIIAMLLPLSAISFMLLVRFLRKGYFANVMDWMSDTSAESQNNTLITDTFFHHISGLSVGLSPAPSDSLETEMVKSNLSLLTNKTSKRYPYSSVMTTSLPLMYDDNDDMRECREKMRSHSTSIVMNAKRVNIIKEHFRVHMYSFRTDASQTTGITMNINSIILNNVTAGYWHWIIIMGVLSSVQNGMMPSLSSYSLLPYGDLAYIYCVTIEKMLNPLTALLPLLLPQFLLNKRFIFISCIGWLLCAFYIMLVAFESPQPFGVNNNENTKGFWAFVIVMVSILCAQLLTVCKTCIYIMIKKSFMSKANFLEQDVFEKAITKIMEIVGISMQIGSFCGALIFFFLVNVTKTFHE